MDPTTFDYLIEKLEVANIFHSQMPVYKQVYITLKRQGAYRNGMILNEIADWVKMEFGIVDLVTRQVIIAVFKTNLRTRHI